MSHLISDAEWEEYQALKEAARLNAEAAAAQLATSSEEDAGEPSA